MSLVYIDAVICREWDKNSEGSAPGDEALEDRTFYAQNGRGDAVALLTSGGTLIETVRYSAYGVPFGSPAGDTDADGDYDLADKDRLADALLAYDVRRDVNLDGVVDSDDITAAGSSGQTLGWGVLSKPGTASRRGYAGYEHEGALAGQWTVYHARHRFYLADWQRWFTRDPIGYPDGPNMYAYVRGMAIVAVDPAGLASCCSSPSLSLPDCPPPRPVPVPDGTDCVNRSGSLTKCLECCAYNPEGYPATNLACAEECFGFYPPPRLPPPPPTDPESCTSYFYTGVGKSLIREPCEDFCAEAKAKADACCGRKENAEACKASVREHMGFCMDDCSKRPSFRDITNPTGPTIPRDNRRDIELPKIPRIPGAPGQWHPGPTDIPGCQWRWNLDFRFNPPQVRWRLECKF